MPLVTCNLIGTGSVDDPFRPPLPTFRFRSAQGNNTVVVEVTPDDLPPDFSPSGTPARRLAQSQRWREYLRARYPDFDASQLNL